MASSTIFSEAQEAADYIRERMLEKPKVAIVCGSGLGGLADAVHEQPRVEVEYSSIPHFPESTGTYTSFPLRLGRAFLLTVAQVQGHAGKLLFGFLGDHTPVVLMVGRVQSVCSFPFLGLIWILEECDLVNRDTVTMKVIL